jgi:hypothetical protein
MANLCAAETSRKSFSFLLSLSGLRNGAFQRRTAKSLGAGKLARAWLSAGDADASLPFVHVCASTVSSASQPFFSFSQDAGERLGNSTSSFNGPSEKKTKNEKKTKKIRSRGRERERKRKRESHLS